MKWHNDAVKKGFVDAVDRYRKYSWLQAAMKVTSISLQALELSVNLAKAEFYCQPMNRPDRKRMLDDRAAFIADKRKSGTVQISPHGQSASSSIAP